MVLRTIAFLGKPNSDHADTLGCLAAFLDLRFIAVPDSPNSGAYTPSRFAILRKLYRGYVQWKGVANSKYLETALTAIDSNDVDIVVAYWGTNPLADAIAIKRHRPNTAVIVNVLCHPKPFSRSRGALADTLFRRAASCLDGFIFPSHQMEKYFQRHIFRSNPAHSTVIYPCWSQKLLPHSDLNPCENEPAILHIGRTELNNRAASRSPNILDQLMARGVNVYHCPVQRPVSPHPNQHCFSYRPLADLIKFGTQFSASFSAFTAPRLNRSLQVRLSIPDRLITSVKSGIPIALPACGYDASEEYLTKFEAVIRFNSVEELASRLRDRDEIQRLKELARNRRSLYNIEAYADDYLRFFNFVLTELR